MELTTEKRADMDLAEDVDDNIAIGDISLNVAIVC